MQNNTSKYTNHTKEEIEVFLEEVKKNIRKGKFVVCLTSKNEKNREFVNKYNLSSNKQKQMLIELEANDFCYSADDYNNPEEKLYVFCREYELNNWGTIEKKEVYVKIVQKDNNFVVIISFHEPEKKIKKLFL